MSQEKSQLENIALPPQDGGVAKKETPRTLPPGFSLGKQLTTKESVEPLSRMEVLKNSLPKYNPVEQGMSEEERDLRARLEKEEMNYDLYLLIKDKLAVEFRKKWLELVNKIVIRDIEFYDALKKTSFDQYLKEEPQKYALQKKDLLFIANNLAEMCNLSPGSSVHPQWGIFLNSFIKTYFDSAWEDQEKEPDLFLPNVDKLAFIGAGMGFGRLEVKEVGDFFGYYAWNDAELKAKKVGDCAGCNICGNAKMEVGVAGKYFGLGACEEAFLKARMVGEGAATKAFGQARFEIGEAGLFLGREIGGEAFVKANRANDYAGLKATDRSRLEVGRADACFGEKASGGSILTVMEVGNHVGREMSGNAKIIITKKNNNIGSGRQGNSQIVLPNGRILRAGDVA